jgi:hypothetical protein
MGKPNPLAGGQRTPGTRAQTMALQGPVNRAIRALLRTPLLRRAVDKTPDHRVRGGPNVRTAYTVPVAYTRHHGTVLIGTEFAWVGNLRTRKPVDIRLDGKRRPADVQVLTDEAGVVEHYAVLARDNHQWAKFNKIALDQAGNPNPDDLHLAWAAGGRAVLLTPH